MLKNKINSKCHTAYHHGDLRASLIAAARDLLISDGISGCTLKQASNMVGVSVAAPYRHFKDKDSLLVAVAHSGFEELAQKITDGRDSHAKGSIDSILHIGRVYVTFAIENPALFRLMFNSPANQCPHSETINPALDEGGDRCFEAFIETVTAFLTAHEISLTETPDLAASLWSIVHGTAALEMEGQFAPKLPGIVPQDLASATGENFLAGFLQKHGKSSE